MSGFACIGVGGDFEQWLSEPKRRLYLTVCCNRYLQQIEPRTETEHNPAKGVRSYRIEESHVF